MRTKDVLLDDFNDIDILYRYLYMSEDHTIDIHNNIVNLRLRMTENLTFKVLNLNFPDLPELDYSEMMTLPQTLGIIDLLKHEPGILGFREGQSRWDEIKDITWAQLALNNDKRKYNLI